MTAEFIFFTPYTRGETIERINVIAERTAKLKMKVRRDNSGEVKTISCMHFQIEYDMEDECGLTEAWGTTYGLQLNARLEIEIFSQGIHHFLKLIGEIMKSIEGDVLFLDNTSNLIMERRSGNIIVDSEEKYFDFKELGIFDQKECTRRCYHLFLDIELSVDKISQQLKEIVKTQINDGKVTFANNDYNFYEMHGDDFQMWAEVGAECDGTSYEGTIDLEMGKYYFNYTIDLMFEIFCNKDDSQMKVMLKYIGGILKKFSQKVVMILFGDKWTGRRACILLEAENGIVKVNQDIPEEEKLPFECMEIPYEECKLGIN